MVLSIHRQLCLAALYVLVCTLLFLTTLLSLYFLEIPIEYSIATSVAYVLAIVVGSSKTVVLKRRVCMNLGGFIIPQTMALYLLYRMWVLYSISIYGVLLATLIAILVAYIASFYIEGYGVGAPLLLVIMVNASLSALCIEIMGKPLAIAIPLSYILSIYSTTIGVDVFKTTRIVRERSVSMEFGGRGLMDLIVLTPALTPPMTIAILILGNM